MKLKILINTQFFFLQSSNEGEILMAQLPFYLYATNNHEFKKQQFYSKGIEAYVGTMTTLSKYDVGFRLLEVPENGEPFNLNNARKIVQEQLSYAAVYFEEFLTYLWFAKDHSVSSSLTFGFIEEREETLVAILNSRGTTMADCTQKDVYFTEDDMGVAIQIIEKILEIYPHKKSLKEFVTPIELDDQERLKTTTIRSLDDHTQYFEFNRIQRSLSLLSILRAVSFLPYKLSLYIPILESLFSPSDGELTFKVSQRVAFYIGSDMSEVKTIFEQVKRVYEIRSRYLHGQPFDNKSKRLNFKEESKNMDDILRRVLKKVILFDSKLFLSKDIESSLNDLVFNYRSNTHKTHST